MTTPRAIDHPQISVGDVAAAMADYRRLGFTLSPQMRHSFGTSNSLIVFQQDYMELIGDFDGVTDPAWRARLDPLARRPGMAHLGLYSTDAEADRRDYLARGGEPNAVDTFTRPVPLPGGGEDMVRCSVCGVARTGYSGMILFACHQHRPDLVWFPELQEHANTAQAVTSITYGAPEPAAHRAYFELMVGKGSTVLKGDDLIVRTGRGGRIEVLTAASLAVRFEGEPFAADDHGVAVEVRVASLAAAAAVLGANGVPHRRLDQRLRVPATAARAVILEFSA